jgi:hypothetical protein
MRRSSITAGDAHRASVLPESMDLGQAMACLISRFVSVSRLRDSKEGISLHALCRLAALVSPCSDASCPKQVCAMQATELALVPGRAGSDRDSVAIAIE